MSVKRKALQDLFVAFVGELETQLKNGKAVMTKSGEVERVSPDAAFLNVLRQLLKDNGIEADPDSDNDPLKGLRLPFKTPEEAFADHETLQ